MASEAAISTAVQLLGDMLIQNVSFFGGIEGEVQLLIDELNRMKSFLIDANKIQPHDDRVRKWISEIRDVAQDAEDAIEMFGEISRKRNYGSLRDIVTFLPSLRIGKEIKGFLARLDAIDKSRKRYGIKDLEESGEPSRRLEVEARRRLAPWEKDEHLVGMEDDVKKLLAPIMDERRKGLWVSTVVGMGGIGKSTLAREVYNHPDVISGRFDCRAWVVISSEFTPQETIKQLILETTNSEHEKKKLRKEIKELEESTKDQLYLDRKLKELLHNMLRGKTYFIVLDDVWKKEHFDSLITAFPKEQDKTSRMLLTTRIKGIESQCQDLHEMKFLDPENSWELFLKKGLNANSNKEFPKELEQIGREIVDKCEGLPLSITMIGGLLAEKRYNMEWKEAINELNSQLERVESNVSAMLEAILELSYENLSLKLKCCFLCLAFFEEDATIPVKRLLNIMIGQGLVQQTGRKTAEETARGYLDELINRNLVQIKDLTLDDRVKSCHLHDSLHKICLKKAKEEIGLEILKRDCVISLHRPRHCVVQWDDSQPFPWSHTSQIRSLFLKNVGKGMKEINFSYWKGFQHLKTLDLDVTYNLHIFPDSFRLLYGLQQLRIHRQRNFTTLKLPTWLDSLKKLELLDMKNELVAFPNIALKMQSLRHIYAHEVCVPMNTDEWNNVETLKYVRQEHWMRSSLRLMDGCHVRELGLFLDDYPSMLGASLEKLENLVKLCLFWPYNKPIDVAIIPQLTNLTKLKLFGVMSKCPSASVFPPNLSHLTLECSSIDEDPMQELGKLQKLSCLKLSGPYIGEKMKVLHDGFPSLRVMSLRDLGLLRSFDMEEGGMPQLKLLQVVNCRDLDTSNLSSKSYQLQILKKTAR